MVVFNDRSFSSSSVNLDECRHYYYYNPSDRASPVSTPSVGNVARVVSLPAPGALGLTARVRNQGGGGGQRPGRVSPLRENELPAAVELLLHRVHCSLDHGVRVVKEGEGRINQLRPGAGHSLLKFDLNYIKKPILTRKRIFHTPTPQS